MDDVEREAIENELQTHLSRVEELATAMKELEELLEGQDDPPQGQLAKLREMKLEMRGRMAAIAMGEARLGVDPM